MSNFLLEGPGGLPQVKLGGSVNTNKPVNIGVTGAGSSSAKLSVGLGGLSVTGPVTFTGTTTGTKNNIIDVTTSTLTLTAAQSGSVVLLDVASGSTVTLPSDSVGLSYTFVVTTTVTTNSYKVIIGSASSYFQGSINVDVAAGTAKYFYGDGSSLLSINLNGTTTGGLFGGQFTVRCVKAGLWQADGNVEGSGTVATPFATS